MMEHYVTLFDSLFLPQGLALHMSMERCVKNYQLWILCVDDKAFDVLTKLNLNHVKLLQLSMLETKELLKIKADRTKGEYCWTLTPFALRFVFEADKTIIRATYLDADLWFRKEPKPIFDELDQSAKAILITDHSYAPEYDQSATSGQYCVQFLTFYRDSGEVVRKWWETKCIEWCYSRFENGKFGDQKYLDNWPELFAEKVHVLREKELMLAPWNATRFPYGNAIIWHFHGLKLLSGQSIYIGEYKIPRTTFLNIYSHYFEDISSARALLKEVGFYIRPQVSFPIIRKLKAAALLIIRPILRPSFIRKIFFYF
jgi:hypothetical protein